MKFKIYRNGELQGTLTVDHDFYHFDGNDECKRFITDSIRNHITLKKDEYMDGDLLLTEYEISQGAPLFAFALIEHLRDNGYELHEEDPELEQAFTAVLSLLSEQTELCTALMGRWALMSPLEKSYLIEQLKRDIIHAE